MDRSPPEFVTGFFSGLASTHDDCVAALLQTLTISETALKKLSGELEIRFNQLAGMTASSKCNSYADPYSLSQMWE